MSTNFRILMSYSSAGSSLSQVVTGFSNSSSLPKCLPPRNSFSIRKRWKSLGARNHSSPPVLDGSPWFPKSLTITICTDGTRIAPSDFDLLLKLKEFLGGESSGNDGKLENAVTTWLNELAAEEYDMGILKLVDRYDKCLNVGVDYVEK
ncbi:hypothetical protein AVEN_108910-1 [Araneus ventricosus]|uniref:Uncharacterized protein n=1 Tax=Araneus ventricosus TaxID=182803 RepID=A0A4Y2P9T5_ARAVE|nr:hypothetical protein AVEN_108910-1 [Araneus ventricosus]